MLTRQAYEIKHALFCEIKYIILFSDETDIDNEISREIDVMLENIQKSL